MARVIAPIVLALVVLGGVLAATTFTFQQASAAQSDRSREALQGAPGQNDAASGQDAGDLPQSALGIDAGVGMWKANLSPPGSDRDWYRAHAAGAFCAVAVADSKAVGTVRLGAGESLGSSVSSDTGPQARARLALAAPSGGAAYLGILPSPTVSTSSFDDTTDTRPGPGRYTFSLDLASHADLPGEPTDAGNTLATASPLARDCSAGTLHQDVADSEDRYFFDITEAAELTVSFAVAAGPAAEVRVLTPTGATHSTIQSGGVTNVWASEPGRWQVVVAAAPAAPATVAANGALRIAAMGALAQTDYLLGVTGPGDPEPCRPSC